MPELPEVETIRRQLEKELVGKSITGIWYDTPKMLRPSPQTLAEGITDRKITALKRRAKLLIIELDNGQAHLTAHLKLSGRLLVRKATDSPDQFVHVKLALNDPNHTELRFANARKFGYLEYLPRGKDDLQRVLSRYGPKPLDDLTAKEFYRRLQTTRRAIKTILLDQKVFSGIGNIYANDSLWLAKIHPETPASQLTQNQADHLLQAIEAVLKEGLKAGGASDQWYRDAYGKKGRYQDHFKVYGRVGQECLNKNGKIKRITVGGRGTFFCPSCQKKNRSKQTAQSPQAI